MRAEEIRSVSDEQGPGRYFSEAPNHWGDDSAFLVVLVEFFSDWTRIACCCALLQVGSHEFVNAFHLLRAIVLVSAYIRPGYSGEYFLLNCLRVCECLRAPISPLGL